MKANPKPLPPLRSDAEAESFVDTADLTQYDLSGFKPMRFEIEPKAAALNMRLPASLLDAVKANLSAINGDIAQLAEAAARGHDVRTQINGYLVRNRATTLASALAFPARLLAAQGAMQCTSGAFVGVDSLIDRLVADGRLLVGLEVTGDLFRTPRFSQLGFDESPCLGCNTRTVLTGPHAGL